MKTTSISSVVVSFGSRRPKRMTPSSERHAPAMIARPRTRSAFASSDPRIDVCATTISPALSAKMTMKSSGQVPERRLEDARRRRPEASPDGLRAHADRPGEQRERDDSDSELDRRVRVRVVEHAEKSQRPRTSTRCRSTSSCRRSDTIVPLMADWETVREIALSLPEVEESAGDRVAFSVRGKGFAWRRASATAEGSPCAWTATRSSCSWTPTPRSTSRARTTPATPAIQIRLEQIARDELRERLEDAWLIQAPKRLAAEFLANETT